MHDVPAVVGHVSACTAPLSTIKVLHLCFKSYWLLQGSGLYHNLQKFRSDRVGTGLHWLEPCTFTDMKVD